ncbi:MAG: peptidylprolyl isomerase [Sediminibacterium sp.]|nr:peptidylprolyl isomerase [Sediminibacterium sp.]
MKQSTIYFFLSLVLFILLVGCAKPVFKEKWLKEEAPSNFISRFETTKGVFDVEITRAWSPIAADRFYQTVKHRFYNNTLFYRVVPGFVAQWGNNDTMVFKKWRPHKIADEPVIESNLRGYMSYARGSKETRGTTLFINLVNNQRLDTILSNGVKGYPPFGKVIKGMEVVDSLYGGYEGKTMSKLDTLQKHPALFMKQFPKLDKVKKAYIIR